MIENNKLTVANYRTSSSASVAVLSKCSNYESGPLGNFFKRIRWLVNCNLNQLEVAVVRYLDGENYSEHHDYFMNPSNEQAGQRLVSISSGSTQSQLKIKEQQSSQN